MSKPPRPSISGQFGLDTGHPIPVATLLYPPQQFQIWEFWLKSSWDTPPLAGHNHSWEADSRLRLFQFSPKGLVWGSRQPFSAFMKKVHNEASSRTPTSSAPQGLPSAGVSCKNNSNQLLTLSPRGIKAAGMTLLEVPPMSFSQNHRTANPQESACLKESNPLFCCPHSGPRGSLGVRFTRQLLDLITRKSVPHLNLSTLSALDCRNAMLADFSATPSFLADTELQANILPSLHSSQIIVQLKETFRLLNI